MQSSEDSLRQETSLNHYKRDVLGKGGQGTVYKYTYPPTGKIYAVKVIEYEDDLPEHDIYLIRESHMSAKFQHAHLLRAHKVFEYDKGFAIVMPLFPQGSLRGMEISQNEVKEVIRQILEALRHLHERGTIHRDIKPGNILVRNTIGEPLDLVVADYGLASPENPNSFVGSPVYIAPEIVQNRALDKSECRQYDEKVDIYALGMLLLYLLRVPMSEPLIANHKKFNEHVGGPLGDQLDACVPRNVERHEALSVADSMLRFDPRSRPSADECLRLPWFSGPPADSLPGQLARVPSNPSGIIPSKEIPVAEPEKTWWHSTGKTAAPAKQVQGSGASPGRYPTRKRKHTERYGPASAAQKFKVSKPLHKSLLTPRPTPEKVKQLWKSEGAQSPEPMKPLRPTITSNEHSKNTEKTTQEFNDLLSWDDSKMDL